MKVFIIGDLHLSFSTNKPMDIFGDGWKDHHEKIRENWEAMVGPEDLVFINGDFSWAMGLKQADADFAFLQRLPGKKVISKGNHDYWWGTMNKMKGFLEEKGYDTIDFLHNNAYLVGDTAICGTRGWFVDEGDTTGQNQKVFQREVQRLATSLQAGKDLGAKELIAVLHYPPLYPGYRCDEIIETMERFGVKHCYYGHLHGPSHRKAVTGEREGIYYHLTSCDATGFAPVLVLEEENGENL